MEEVNHSDINAVLAENQLNVLHRIAALRAAVLRDHQINGVGRKVFRHNEEGHNVARLQVERVRKFQHLSAILILNENERIVLAGSSSQRIVACYRSDKINRNACPCIFNPNGVMTNHQRIRIFSAFVIVIRRRNQRLCHHQFRTLEGIASIVRNRDDNIFRQLAILINVDTAVSIYLIGVQAAVQICIIILNGQHAVIKRQRVQDRAVKINHVFAIRTGGLIIVCRVITGLATFNRNQGLSHHHTGTLEGRNAVQTYADDDIALITKLVPNGHAGGRRAGICIRAGVLRRIVIFDGQRTALKGQNVQAIHQEIDVIRTVKLHTYHRRRGLHMNDREIRRIVPHKGANRTVQIERKSHNAIRIGIGQRTIGIQVIIRTRPAGVVVIDHRHGTCRTVCRDGVKRNLINGHAEEGNFVFTNENVRKFELGTLHGRKGQGARDARVCFGGNGNDPSTRCRSRQRVSAVAVICQHRVLSAGLQRCGKGTLRIRIHSCAKDDGCRAILVDVYGVHILIGKHAVLAHRRINFRHIGSGDNHRQLLGGQGSLDGQRVSTLRAGKQHDRAIPVRVSAFVINGYVVQIQNCGFGQNIDQTHRKGLACRKGDFVAQRRRGNDGLGADPFAVLIKYVFGAQLFIQLIIRHENVFGRIFDLQITLTARLRYSVIIYGVGNQIRGVVSGSVFIRLAVVLGRRNINVAISIILTQGETYLYLIQSSALLTYISGGGEGEYVIRHALIADNVFRKIAIGICFCHLIQAGDQGSNTVEGILCIVIVTKHLRESITVDQCAGGLIRLTNRSVGILFNTKHTAIVQKIPVGHRFCIGQIVFGDVRAVGTKGVINRQLILHPSIILKIDVTAIDQIAMVFAHVHCLINGHTALDIAANVAAIHVIVIVCFFVFNHTVTAGSRMPVLIGIHRPCVNKGVLVAAVVFTNIASAVVIGVFVRSLILDCDGALASRSVPVAVFIRGPLCRIRMRMTVIISANVANTVFIGICVCVQGSLGRRAVCTIFTSGCVPVIGFVH